ncbi:ATP-binding protein [Sphingomonas profundi]|uniref:ATP-binding protein n=1 Tax=Alterirhizorhabdus profundi TaxID=2681549 RepID=UPI0012E7757C|nr:ATP-binding protein [Sphingomonas profundi]
MKLASLVRWLDGRSKARRIDHATMLTEPLELAASEEITVLPHISAEEGAAIDRRTLARVFDAAHPVRTRAELHGRDQELGYLLTATLDFRQHTVIHGARGSGKTSLVRVFGDHADQSGVVVIYMACEPENSFAELLLPYLQSIPPAAFLPGQKDQFRRRLDALPADFGPRTFVELVAESVGSPVVLIFDEFDRITDAGVKSDIAAAMKLLSDALADVLFMLVGIARNVGEVVDSHPSLRRHMRVVSIGRILDAAVEELIDQGERSAGLAFSPDARALIARAACGSPYHVRTFCHHAALAALRHGGPIDAADVRAGLQAAFDGWARMNEDDAATFAAALRSSRSPDAIERAAGAAARKDAVDAGSRTALAPVESALVPIGDGDDLLAFRDSLAPQYLIALIILSQGAEPERASAAA